MDRIARNKSLTFRIAIILSILLVIVISALSVISYDATKDEILRKFVHVGEKLRDASAGNAHLIEEVAHVYKDGGNASSETEEILGRLPSETIDDYLVSNAYYFLTEMEERDSHSYFALIAMSDTLAEAGLKPGDVFEDSGVFREGFI